VNRGDVDLEKLRVALRRMSRGHLLMVAERAIAIVPRARARRARWRHGSARPTRRGEARRHPLLEEVRTFHDASLRGEYYDSFAVNSKNFMDKSDGTEAFIAELDRFVGQCVRAGVKGPHAPVREAFELLLALLRRLDEDPDRVVFFADEGGSWQVGVDWRAVLPAYFQCLAEGTPADDFARQVDRAISDFADDERPRHLAAAQRAANAEQKAALRRLPAREGRR